MHICLGNIHIYPLRFYHNAFVMEMPYWRKELINPKFSSELLFREGCLDILGAKKYLELYQKFLANLYLCPLTSIEVSEIFPWSFNKGTVNGCDTCSRSLVISSKL